MYRKNVSGQHVHVGAINATTGAPLSGVTISVRRCLDGTFGAGGGTLTEDTGTGFFKYALAQADTNAVNCAFWFTGTNMVPVKTEFVTTSADPTDGVRFGLTGLANAVPGAAGGLLIAGSNAATTFASLTCTGNFSINGTNTVAQTGDSFARIGATGSGLTSLAPASTALSTAVWTAPPTGFLAATFPSTVASPTNITAGTLTTVTNLTNLPSIPANWLTSTGIAAGALNGKGDWSTAANVSAVPGLVWDVALAGHLSAGSTGFALNASSSAGDPWATMIPGAYGPGTAGDIVGTFLDAAISGLPSAIDNADALLKRDMSAVTGEASRSPLNAFRAIRNKWSFPGGVYTVTKEDDTTTAWTGAPTTDVSALPITGMDPA